MIIRAILVIFILAIVIWFMTQKASTKKQAGGKLIVLIFFIFAVIAVLFPGSTNVLAHKVGVGRGADLLLYILTLVFVLSLLIQYLRRHDDQIRIEKIVRKIAIIEAIQDPHNIRLIKKIDNEIS